jgi:hypothetical protein
VTDVVFQSVGTSLVLREALNNWESGLAMSSATYFRRHGCHLSGYRDDNIPLSLRCFMTESFTTLSRILASAEVSLM